MPEHIGNVGTRAVAWAEHIRLSVNPRASRDREVEKLTGSLLSFFGPGEPLEPTSRRVMEEFFGYDLDRVRVHRGQGAEETSRKLGARAFTFRGHIFAPKENLDTSTGAGLGLLAHELTHAVQQTQPSRRPQAEVAGEGTSLAAAATPGSHSDVEMVLLAPARSTPSSTSPQAREAQAEASERLVGEVLGDEQGPPPGIDPEAVADRVYHLMRCDLVLERERATGWG